MRKDRKNDPYTNHLDLEDQRTLNSYMDNLNLEYNDELDEYLAHIEEQQDAFAQAREERQREADARMYEEERLRDEYTEAVADVQSNDIYEHIVGDVQPEGVYTETVEKEQPEGVYMETVEKEQPEGVYMETVEKEQPPGEYEEIVEEERQEYAQDAAGINMQDVQPGGIASYVEIQPVIENFQDYTTANMRPVVDTIRYKDDSISNNKNADNSRNNNRNAVVSDNLYSDDMLYIDNGHKSNKASVIIAVLLIFLAVGGGVFAVHHFTDGFKDFTFMKKDDDTEAVTEAYVTTEEVTEEATTEEPVKPYATVDYTLHEPHMTDSTIVYNSNPYSLRFPQEEWPITRDDDGNQREATQEDLYPVIDLEAKEGSLNYTNPDPSNPGETQQMTSRYMVLVDMSDDSIIAERDSDVVVNPASMTKILTVLTAVDMIEDLDDTYEVPMEAIDYSMVNGCSAVGFLAGEKITVRDMIYGTIVCSGADAAVTLADYCCGSQDAFVEKMNEKVEELGISDTAHFTNVVGVYDENLHCTMEDMAVIISTAMQNELLRDVLNTRIYQTTADSTILPEDVRKELGITVDEGASGAESGETVDSSTTEENVQGDGGAVDDNNDAQNIEGEDVQEGTADQADTAAADGGQTDEASVGEQPVEGQAESTDGSSEESTTEEIDPGVLLVATEGIQISNWFMRRIEDKDTGGEVLGAKTGFVNAAGFCCASYYKSNSGKEYVCVTGDTYSSWRCIYDHVGIYRSLTK